MNDYIQGATSRLPAGFDLPDSTDAALTSRRSVRGFLPTPVPRATIEHLLEVASRAPSGTNMQPWRVYVVTGTAKEALTAAILAARGGPDDNQTREYKYYPDKFFEPYLARRRKVGWDLYGLLGISRGETERMRRQHSRNFEFFGAPVGLIFTIDERLEIGSWLDYGMFIQSVSIAARAQGLHSCPQAAFCSYHAIIRDQLGVPEGETVVCGMSIGYLDPDLPENRLRTERATVGEFATFLGD